VAYGQPLTPAPGDADLRQPPGADPGIKIKASGGMLGMERGGG
jgi:hypothetical protein